MTMTMTDVTPRNGSRKTNGPPPATPEELAVQHGIATYNKIVQDRDDLARRLEIAEKLIAVNKIEIEGLRAEKAAAESRIISYQGERDEAVTDLAVYQALFISVQSLLRTFGVEHASLVREPVKKQSDIV